MANIICVTCRRDFSDFKRQVKSFEKHLQLEHSITYIIEDADNVDTYVEFINSSSIKNNIKIFPSTRFIPKDIIAHGHIKQQLLKLLAAADSVEEECWVIDSKDFLVSSPDTNSIDPFPAIEADPARDPHFFLKDKYCKKFNFKYVDKLSLPWTPFKLIKSNVIGLINLLGATEFTEWFLSEPEQCEFYLYQMYCYSNDLPIEFKYKETVIKLWPYIISNTPSEDYLELVKDKLTKDGIQWISKHRWAHHSWNNDVMNVWKRIISLNELAEYDVFFEEDKHEFIEFVNRNCKIKE